MASLLSSGISSATYSMLVFITFFGSEHNSILRTAPVISLKTLKICSFSGTQPSISYKLRGTFRRSWPIPKSEHDFLNNSKLS